MTWRSTLALGLACLTLSSCTTASAVDVSVAAAVKATRGRPITPTVHLEAVRITWRRVTPDQLVRIKGLVSPFTTAPLHGLALLDEGAAECHVYAVEPAVDGSPEMTVLGHELLHCFAGGFHGDTPPDAATVRVLRAKIEDLIR